MSDFQVLKYIGLAGVFLYFLGVLAYISGNYETAALASTFGSLCLIFVLMNK